MSLFAASPAGTGFYAAGVLNLLFAWLFFRRPGVSFWTCAPVWRANRYLYPAGVALWVTSCTFMLAGVVLLLYRASAGSCLL